MSEVRGKSINKRNSTMNLVDDVVEVKVKPGMFFGKSESRARSFRKTRISSRRHLRRTWVT